jgi:hypothetical protein
MSDNNANYLYDSASGASLTNVNNTISGSGNIGNSGLEFINDANGVVDAVSTHGNTLLIQTASAGTTNLGTMEASSGGTLEIESTTVTNTNGTTNGVIQALAGGTVLLQGATVAGGTLTTVGSGVIVAQAGSELNGSTNTVTNAGILQIPNNNTLLFTGTINNTGSIQSLSNNNDTGLELNSATGTLQGTGGSITFSDNNANYIYSATTGNQLTIAQPVSGPGGNIGDGTTVITNQSTIDATVSTHGNTLTIQPDGTFTNNSILEATGGGSLALDAGTFLNANGTITAGSTSTVTLENSVTVAGGTLSGAGTFVSNNGSTLDGSTNTVNLSSTTFEIPNDTSTFFKGTLNNTGTIEVQSTNNVTALELNSATGTLGGTGGTITFSDNNQNYIYSATSGNQLTIAQPISGAGGNIGDGDTVLINQSTIDATLSAHGNTLTIQPGSTFTNSDLLEATGGGSLALDAGTFTNTHGTITAGSGSTVTLENGVTVTGGTLNGAGTFVADNNTTLNGLTNASTIQLPNNTTSFLEGAITNTGTIQVNSTNNDTVLGPSGAVTLTGGGALTLSDNNANFIENGGGSLTNVNNTISGSGNIGDGTSAITNEAAGVVDATSSRGNTLTFNSPAGVNAGLIEASSGGTLLVEGTITNTGGTIEGLAGTGSSAGGTVVINAATITGGTLNTLGTGVNASSMTAENGAILNGVTNNATIGIPNNNDAEIEGTVTNNGSINVNSTNNETVLYIKGNTTLNGTGTIVLNNNNANNYIFGAAGTEVLTNNSNTIEGSGNIGDGTLGVINNAGGTILANQPNTLIIDPNSSGITNNGTLQVNTGSLMNIEGTGALTNFNSSTSTLTGGTYNINGGTLEFVGANIVNNAADIILTGSAAEIVNSSNSANALANFTVNEAAGTFQLGAGHSFTTAGTFTNDGSLIVGAGDTFKVSNGDLTNFASSTLTGGSYFVAGTLQFGAGGASITTNDASLTLSGASPSVINLGNGNLLANLATNDSGARFAVVNGASYTTAGAFANSGTLDLENGGTLKVAGALTNSGTVSTNGTNQGGSANTLTVTGTLTNNTGGTVAIGENNDTSDIANVGILTNAATVTVGAGATLNLTSSGTDTNTGTITVTNGTLSLATTADLDMEQGGKLAVTGNLTNAGTISTNAANLGGSANTITVSGTLTNDSGATLTIGANNDTTDTATVGSLANSGTVTVGTGASLTIDGTNSNSGTINVDGTLDFKKNNTLTGRGSLTLTNGTIAGVGAAPTLDNKSTIEGSGTISNLGITNAGTLSANSGTLSILPASAGLDNTGTIVVSAGDAMKIGTSAGGALTNFSGTTLTGGTYNISGTLQFGSSGATIATNAATITLSGTGEMIDFGNNNILAGFNNNSSTGVFKLASAASLITTGGAFINSGLFTVSTGTTFTVGGSSFNFTQAAGATTVDGTLTSTTTGTLDITGGDVDGKGTLGYNVVDSGILSPGDSAAKTGKLTVADTYTQESTGTLAIQIDGTTATKYDKLQVTGDATLDTGSTLDINLKAGVTLSAGQKFTILTSAALTGQFTTVNGQVISTNPPLYFAVSYPAGAGTVVLTVTSGTPPTSPASSSLVSTQLIHAPLTHGSIHGSIGKGHYGLEVYRPALARIPAVSPALSMARTPVSQPASLGSLGTSMHAFHPLDDFGSPVAGSAPAGIGDAGAAGSLGLSPVSAAAYNSMGAMNHMRFEAGVDLKALLKTSRRQLWKGLWAAPDSRDALSIGYMTFNGAH